MNRAEAVNWLINIMSDIGKAEHRNLWCYEQALSEIREMIEHECEKCVFRPFKQFQPKPRWISCSERLPEKYGNYLVTTDDGEVDIGSCDPENKDRQDHFWSGCDADGFFWYGENIVIAWMPLPEPYQGEGEQDG